jgi:capsular exopolysaccharide synthesis family protein
MELRQYLSLLRRWWWLIALLATLGGAAAFPIVLLRTPVYETSTTVLINQAPGALPNAEDVLSGQRVAATYAELLHQRAVLVAVIANLNLQTDPETLDGSIRISPVRDTNLLVLTVRDTDPQRAAAVANEIVKVFIAQNLQSQTEQYAATLGNLQTEMDNIQQDVDRTESSIKSLENAKTPELIAERTRLEELLSQQRGSYATLLAQYEQSRLAQTQTTDRVSIVEEALPGKSAGQSIIVIALQGIVIGITAACGIAILVEYLRDTMKSSEELEQLLGIPTLAVIGTIQTSEPERMLVAVDKPRSPIAEAYRLLRANIEIAAIDNPAHSLVITSSGPSEGKSVTAANLAIAIAQTGKQVVLLDTDLRRPSLHKMFRVSNKRGVTTALLQGSSSTLGDHLTATGIEGLTLLTSGPLPPNPAELLGSQRMADLIRSLTSQADMIVLDSPPVLAVADATLLARTCDATLLVVLAEATQSEVLKRAKNQIEQAGSHLLGVVLNRVSSSSGGYYYYQKYYQRYSAGEE